MTDQFACLSFVCAGCTFMNVCFMLILVLLKELQSSCQQILTMCCLLFHVLYCAVLCCAVLCPVICVCWGITDHCGSDHVCLLCPDHDGCHCGYNAPVGRGRHRFPISHFPYRSLRLVLHCCLYASSRIQMHYPWSPIPPLYSLYVPPSHHLFAHQPQQCIMGNS